MSDSPAEITRAAFEEVILAKVIENPAFAARLKADPKAALCEAFDVEFPADLQISVFQETPNHLMLRIPLMMTDEIAESELDLPSSAAAGLHYRRTASTGAGQST
jgi:hypothetical protein